MSEKAISFHTPSRVYPAGLMRREILVKNEINMKLGGLIGMLRGEMFFLESGI